MALWKIERTDDIGWDEYIGYVVRAKTEEEARNLVGWTNKSRADCSRLNPRGKAEILFDSFNAG